MPVKALSYHSYLCDRIRNRKKDISNSEDIVIKRADFRVMLGWYNVPYDLQISFIRELRAMGLIKVKDKQNIVLLKKKGPGDWFN